MTSATKSNSLAGMIVLMEKLTGSAYLNHLTQTNGLVVCTCEFPPNVIPLELTEKAHEAWAERTLCEGSRRYLKQQRKELTRGRG